MRIEPFSVERFFAIHEFNVKHLLCASDCEALTIGELLALEPGSVERFHQHGLGYTESQGSPALREAIADIYQTLETDDIIVHSGAEEAIFTLMNSVLDAGDHVIVHWPCYPSLANIAKAIGCEVAHWQAREVDGWALDVDELETMIQPNTKLIVINLPHNPTGYVMDLASFERVNGIAASHGILLFSDEVYRESEYDPALRLPSASDLGAHAVSLGVTSKTYGLPGLRIGWLATRNQEVFKRVSEFKDYTTICSSSPSEWLATLALRHRKKLVDKNLGIITENLKLADAFLSKHAAQFSWVRPMAGSIGFPRLLSGDIRQLTEDLIKDESLLLLPGNTFGDTDNHFRLGLGRRSFPEGLARFDAWLDSHA